MVIFSNCRDFSHYEEGELNLVRVANFVWNPYEIRYDDSRVFSYFIPKSKVVFVEEKVLKPFDTIEEFANATGCKRIGEDIITIRNKIDEQEQVLLYIGCSDDTVHLGGYLLTLRALFENYEFSYEDKWLPFGVDE